MIKVTSSSFFCYTLSLTSGANLRFFNLSHVRQDSMKIKGKCVAKEKDPNIAKI